MGLSENFKFVLILDKWFFNNFLVSNSDKCHFMTPRTTNTLPSFKCKKSQSETESPKIF